MAPNFRVARNGDGWRPYQWICIIFRTARRKGFSTVFPGKIPFLPKSPATETKQKATGIYTTVKHMILAISSSCSIHPLIYRIWSNKCCWKPPLPSKIRKSYIYSSLRKLAYQVSWINLRYCNYIHLANLHISCHILATITFHQLSLCPISETPMTSFYRTNNFRGIFALFDLTSSHFDVSLIVSSLLCYRLDLLQESSPAGFSSFYSRYDWRLWDGEHMDMLAMQMNNICG